MSFVYKVFSDYSIQEAYGQIYDYVNKAFDLKLNAIALTDHHSISGIPEFLQTIAKKNSKSTHKLRGIVGCTLNIQYNGQMGTLTVLCKNLKGWHDLIKILAQSKLNEKSLYVDYTTLTNLTDNLIAIHGGIGSILSKLVFPNYYKSYTAQNTDEIESLDIENIKNSLSNLSTLFRINYGSIESGGLAIDNKLNDIIKRLCESNNWPLLEGNPVYYVNKEDRICQQIVLCSKCKTTLKDTETILMGDNYRYFWETESNSLENIGDQNDGVLTHIEDFNISNKPQLPLYSNPLFGSMSSFEILKQLCRQGWVARGLKEKLEKNPQLKEVYTKRIQEELALFEETGLSDYILLIYDFAHFIRSNGASCGLRGSAVGLFISYLLGVSDVDCLMPDPTLPYHKDRELSLSRFYNKWRNTKDNVSLPDIDLDLPISFRENLIHYCQNKYGKNNVAHIITFLRMDGKMALKEIFRVLDREPNSFQLANTITSYFVDKAKVQDELEDVREDNPKYNIVNYNIDNVPRVKEYSEEYPEEFALAIKMADVIRAQGKHAAGIVIAPTPLSDNFPVTYDKNGELLVALEMADAEYVGAVKYDFLGVAAYEKMDVICSMINNSLREPPINNYKDGVEESEII